MHSRIGGLRLFTVLVGVGGPPRGGVGVIVHFHVGGGAPRLGVGGQVLHSHGHA